MHTDDDRVERSKACADDESCDRKGRKASSVADPELDGCALIGLRGEKDGEMKSLGESERWVLATGPRDLWDKNERMQSIRRDNIGDGSLQQ